MSPRTAVRLALATAAALGCACAVGQSSLNEQPKEEVAGPLGRPDGGPAAPVLDPWVHVPPPPPLPAPARVESKVAAASLPNGLRVVVVERHHRPLVWTSLILPRGSLLDKVGRGGAHPLVGAALGELRRARGAAARGAVGAHPAAPGGRGGGRAPLKCRPRRHPAAAQRLLEGHRPPPLQALSIGPTLKRPNSRRRSASHVGRPHQTVLLTLAPPAVLGVNPNLTVHLDAVVIYGSGETKRDPGSAGAEEVRGLVAIVGRARPAYLGCA